jgi:hypothetical protein
MEEETVLEQENQDDDSQKPPIEEFFDLVQTFNWPDLKKEGNEIFVDRTERISIYKLVKSIVTINLIWYDRKNVTYSFRSSPKTVIFNKDTNFNLLLYIGNGKYKLSYDYQIKSVLQLDSQIEKIDIRKSHKSITVLTSQKIAKVPLKKFLLIKGEIAIAVKQAKSYRDSVERHYVNEITRKYRKKDIKRVTTTQKGEFDFLVKRLNLETKKNENDYHKYLNDKDISALQELTRELVKNCVFDKNFLEELDDYFIRKKLADIIKLGNMMLKLKSTDLTTKPAKEVIKSLKIKGKISQLETLWQKFFDEHLLYLIFSYKGLFSKIELQLDGDDKVPDFIGVNHYNGLDVIEIKTHLTPALVWDPSHKNYSFSSELSKAIIQTTNYIDAIKQHSFSDDDKRKITTYTDEENLYRPRGIIIVSSTNKLVKNGRGDTTKLNRDFTKLRNSLHDIEILTFDEVINIADNYTKNIIRE